MNLSRYSSQKFHYSNWNGKEMVHMKHFKGRTYLLGIWFINQFSSDQLLSHVWLLATPWIAACQAFLSITNSQSLLKHMSIESMMPFNHPFWRRSVWNIHWKDWCWSWNSNTLAIWCEELTHWKRPWCWERLKVEEKGVTEDETVVWHHQLSRHEFE